MNVEDIRAYYGFVDAAWKITKSVSVAEQQILREKSSVECRVQECEGLSRERERVTASAVRESTGNHRCKSTPKPVL